ncbi:Uncharacterised protein [Mycobacteroides abscessus subsp. abscessus]|nr:Uncharacterised protein [Mycobacteroides abscessus subsp. abscessus]
MRIGRDHPHRAALQHIARRHRAVPARRIGGHGLRRLAGNGHLHARARLGDAGDGHPPGVRGHAQDRRIENRRRPIDRVRVGGAHRRRRVARRVGRDNGHVAADHVGARGRRVGAVGLGGNGDRLAIGKRHPHRRARLGAAADRQAPAGGRLVQRKRGRGRRGLVHGIGKHRPRRRALVARRIGRNRRDLARHHIGGGRHAIGAVRARRHRLRFAIRKDHPHRSARLGLPGDGRAAAGRVLAHRQRWRRRRRLVQRIGVHHLLHRRPVAVRIARTHHDRPGHHVGIGRGGIAAIILRPHRLAAAIGELHRYQRAGFGPAHHGDPPGLRIGGVTHRRRHRRGSVDGIGIVRTDRRGAIAGLIGHHHHDIALRRVAGGRDAKAAIRIDPDGLRRAVGPGDRHAAARLGLAADGQASRRGIGIERDLDRLRRRPVDRVLIGLLRLGTVAGRVGGLHHDHAGRQVAIRAHAVSAVGVGAHRFAAAAGKPDRDLRVRFAAARDRDASGSLIRGHPCNAQDRGGLVDRIGIGVGNLLAGIAVTVGGARPYQSARHIAGRTCLEAARRIGAHARRRPVGQP